MKEREAAVNVAGYKKGKEVSRRQMIGKEERAGKGEKQRWEKERER